MNILLCRLTKKELMMAFGLILASLVLQYSPILLEYAVRKNVTFVEVSSKVWEANLSSLDPGRYYLSVGRPQGSCEFLINGHVISSTKGELLEIRPQLTLGSGFKILSHSHDEPIVAKILCEEQPGFSSRLHHRPIVAGFFSGFVLQAARIFTDLLMGPLASLLLLFSVLLSPPKLSEDLRLNRRFILFSLASLFYSASLAQMGSLFLEGVGFTVLHIILRTCFSGAYVYLCSNYSKAQTKLLLIHLLVAITAILLGLFASSDLEAFYNAQYILFPISSLVVTLSLIRAPQKSRVSQTLISLGLAWTVLQCFDFVNMTLIYGPYVGPAFIAIIALMVAIVRYQEIIKSEIAAQKAIANAKASVEIAQLSAKIAHDVRSPLALLKVLSRDEAMPDDLKKLLIAASDRIRGIADTLLEKHRELVREQSSSFKAKHEMATQSADIVELVTIVVEEKRRIAENVSIHFNSESIAPLRCCIEPLEFSRLLSNLIDNAIEATDANGKIVISVISGTDYHQLSIKDNGRGISKDLLSKLFENGATFGKSNGNGLGLYSAKRALETWGGTIGISSTVGQGTEVLVTLPRRMEASE